MSAFMVNNNVMAKVVTAILLNFDAFDGRSTARGPPIAAPTDAPSTRLSDRGGASLNRRPRRAQ